LGILLIAGLGSLSYSPALTAPELPILDLTQEPPPEERPMGAPGAVFGGGVGYDINPPPYVLPLEARIRAVRPPSVRPGQKFDIEVVLRNTGSAPFYLPASLHTSKVHQPGNKGRHTFLFQIRFLPPEQREEMTTVMASSQSSESVAKSRLQLGPQESVSVLFRGDLALVSGWISAGVTNVSIQVVCSEWTLENDRYFIKARSKEILSHNIVEIDIQP